MQQHVQKFHAHDLANTAWAFAMARQSDELLFAALLKRSGQRIGEFKPQGLTRMA